MARGAGGSEHRDTAGVSTGARQRRLRVLAVVGAVAAMTLMSQTAAATQPEPPPETTTLAAAPTTPAPTTATPTTTPATTATTLTASEGSTTTRGRQRRGRRRRGTTTVVPTPVAAVGRCIRRTPSVIRRPVRRRCRGGCSTRVDPGPDHLDLRRRAVGAEPGSRLRLGFGDDDARRPGHRSDVATTVTIDDGPEGRSNSAKTSPRPHVRDRRRRRT